jgi:3-phenylpropionate/trans-cinnamate dioxygenase ferredoxin subunit
VSEWKPVGTEGLLEDGEMTEVKVDDAVLLLARVEGQYYAAQGLCPHMRAHLARGKLNGFVVTCPAHRSQFDLREGRNLEWTPKLPRLARRMARAFQPPRDLRTYDTRVEASQVWVEMD